MSLGPLSEGQAENLGDGPHEGAQAECRALPGPWVPEQPPALALARSHKARSRLETVVWASHPPPTLSTDKPGPFQPRASRGTSSPTSQIIH